MNLLFVTIFIANLNVSIGAVPVNCDLNSMRWKTLPSGPDPPGSPLISWTVHTYQTCSSLCRFYKDCTHYTWTEDTGLCHLVSDSHATPLTTCQNKAKPCGERPCKPEEMCIHVKGATAFICLPASATTYQVQTTSSATTTTAATDTSTVIPTTSTAVNTPSTTSLSPTTTPAATTPSTSITPTTTTTPTPTTTTITITTTPTTTTTLTTTTTATTTTTSTTTITTTTTTTATTTTTTQALMTLGMSCTSSLECIVLNAECHNEACRCILGYQFSYTLQQCSKSCADLGTDFTRYINTGIYEYNEVTHNVNSVEECEQHCLNTVTITCRTFEMFGLSCRLASVHWYDVANTDRMTNLANIDLYARQCL